MIEKGENRVVKAGQTYLCEVHGNEVREAVLPDGSEIGLYVLKIPEGNGGTRRVESYIDGKVLSIGTAYTTAYSGRHNIRKRRVEISGNGRIGELRVADYDYVASDVPIGIVVTGGAFVRAPGIEEVKSMYGMSFDSGIHPLYHFIVTDRRPKIDIGYNEIDVIAYRRGGLLNHILGRNETVIEVIYGGLERRVTVNKSLEEVAGDLLNIYNGLKPTGKSGQEEANSLINHLNSAFGTKL